jgi:hypothetical protein
VIVMLFDPIAKPRETFVQLVIHGVDNYALTPCQARNLAQHLILASDLAQLRAGNLTPFQLAMGGKRWRRATAISGSK